MIFIEGESRKAQVLMRGRVLAQGFTVLLICAGGFAGYKPHNRPKTYEEIIVKDVESGPQHEVGTK